MNQINQKGSVALGTILGFSVLIGMTGFYIQRSANKRIKSSIRAMNQLEGFYPAEIAAWVNHRLSQSNYSGLPKQISSGDRYPATVENIYPQNPRGEILPSPNPNGAMQTANPVFFLGNLVTQSPNYPTTLFRRNGNTQLQLPTEGKETSGPFCGMTDYGGKNIGAKVCLVSTASPLSCSMWTWMGSGTGQSPVYGTKGIASTANWPGMRTLNSAARGVAGSAWLFGGYAFAGIRNDLWKFDGTNWAWLSGAMTPGQSDIYGTQGIASSANTPGARYETVSWSDNAGNFWLFGGQDYTSSAALYNDLWKFDGTNWKWISGSQNAGSYGTRGLASPSNSPPRRISAVRWSDSKGNLWFFGGLTGDNSFGNDLWKFDGKNWTWVSGSDLPNQLGVHGASGVASPSNVPGARHYAMGWIDSGDNLWLFGGSGFGTTASASDLPLADLWKFDGSNWTWISGGVGTSLHYGVKGISNPSNHPGIREAAVTWEDAMGNFWLFGGVGEYGRKNDLWKFDGKNWTWVSGPNTYDGLGNLGTIGVSSVATNPASRYGSSGWMDTQGNLWLFGGSAYGTSADSDLWKFTPCNLVPPLPLPPRPPL